MHHLLLITLATLLIAFLGIVATRPSDFRVTRSTAISAPPPIIFAQVDDLTKWETWSPWDKMDPTLKKTFGRTSAGAGAGYSWIGNKKVGEGRMTIAESRPNEFIRIHLEFLKPFKATSTAEFTFKPEGDQTIVTWSTFGKNNFMAKAFWLFVDLDKMMGGEFAKGLAQLKLLAEAAA